MTVTLTDERKRKVKDACMALLAANYHKIRFVAKIIGLFTSSFAAVKYGNGNAKLEEAFRTSKEVHNLINSAISHNEAHQQTQTTIKKGVPHILMDDLRWLVLNYTTGGKRVSRFWGITHEKENKPEWWPAEVPFSHQTFENDMLQKPSSKVDQAMSDETQEEVDPFDIETTDPKESRYSKKVLWMKIPGNYKLVSSMSTRNKNHHLKKAATFPAESPNTIPRITSERVFNSVQSNGWADFVDKWEKWMSLFTACRVLKIFVAIRWIPFNYVVEVAIVLLLSFMLDLKKMHSFHMVLAPLTAIGNGDCLFNLMGKLMFGTEVVSPILRLVAAAEGIRHWRHYVEEYRERFLTRDCALQMLYSMSTPGVLTTVTGVDSTFYYHDFRSSTRKLNEPINVMFVSVGKSPFPNHYIPLVWKVGKRASAPSLKASVKERMCAASKKLGCHALVGEKEEWVFCKRCKLCYHAVCSGVNANRKSFICCIDDATKYAIKNDINAIAIHFDDTFRILQNTTCQESNVFVADTHHSNDIVEAANLTIKYFQETIFLHTS
eukprot:gene2514-2904_t